jgi:hypothetical protein
MSPNSTLARAWHLRRGGTMREARGRIKAAENGKSRESPALPEAFHKRLSAYALAAGQAGAGILAISQTAAADIVYTPADMRVLHQPSFEPRREPRRCSRFSASEYSCRRRSTHLARQMVLLLLHEFPACKWRCKRRPRQQRGRRRGQRLPSCTRGIHRSGRPI